MEEPVEVGVLFSPRKPYPEPRWILWRGVREPVETIHLVHERREAGVRHFVYALSVRGTWLQVRFDPVQARWYLEEVHPLEEP